MTRSCTVSFLCAPALGAASDTDFMLASLIPQVEATVKAEGAQTCGADCPGKAPVLIALLVGVLLKALLAPADELARCAI